MTKQEAVETVNAEIKRLNSEAPKCDNPATACACWSAAAKLQWALDLLTDCDETKGK